MKGSGTSLDAVKDALNRMDLKEKLGMPLRPAVAGNKQRPWGMTESRHKHKYGGVGVIRKVYLCRNYNEYEQLVQIVKLTVDYIVMLKADKKKYTMAQAHYGYLIAYMQKMRERLMYRVDKFETKNMLPHVF